MISAPPPQGSEVFYVPLICNQVCVVLPLYSVTDD